MTWPSNQFLTWYVQQGGLAPGALAYKERVEADGGQVINLGCVPSGVWDAFPTGFVGALDPYPNAAAVYCVYRLYSSYTGSLLRVRRSSDNTEQDIGYDSSGYLDTASLLAFVGANDGFVTTWYDQSGNSKDMTQSLAANQPKIVSSGVLEIESDNSLATLSWASNDLSYLRAPWNATASQSWFGVFNPLNDSFIAITEVAAGSDRDWIAQSGSANTTIYGFDNSPDLYVDGSLQSLTTRADVYTALSTNGNIIYSTIDLDISSWDDTSDWFFFGHGGGASNLFNYSGNTQAWVVFESDQSANRTGIESALDNLFFLTPPSWDDTEIWDDTETWTE